MAEEKKTVQDEQLMNVTGGSEAEVKGTCSKCGKILTDGMFIREIHGEKYCEECFDKLTRGF